MRPDQKYESTWEKVANRIKDVTPVQNQADALSDLGNLLLLTYALRNADCHTKNIALLGLFHNCPNSRQRMKPVARQRHL